MLRGRLLWSIPNRLSGHQNKWSMLKYRVDIEEKPYHEEQFAIADDIDFSYLLPKDHPNYKPPGKPVKSENCETILRLTFDGYTMQKIVS